MTHEEFTNQMSDASQAAQLRLSKAARDKAYWEIPVDRLKPLYEKYRNINFNTPNDPFQLAVVTFGFVDLAVIHRMKELYFAALKAPESWPAVVEQCRREADALASAVINEMDQELGRQLGGV